MTNSLLQRWTARLLTALPVLSSLLWLGGDFRRTYGPTHYFLNYQHGFQKRALFGQLLLPLDFISLHAILVIELIIFATLIAATYFVFRRTLFGTLQERALAAFLLSAPALLPHFAYLSGDLDCLLYICAVLAVGAFLAMPAAFAIAFAIALSIAALLIHEGFVLLFYPLLLAIMIDLCRRQRLKVGMLVAQFVIVATVFAAVLHYGKWSVPHPEFMAAAQQRTSLELEGTAFLVLSSTLQQQLHFVTAMYTRNVVAAILVTCLVSLPYFATLVWLMRRALANRGYTSRHRWGLLVLLCAPLLLLPLGHDAMRWISAICVNASLFLLYLYTAESEPAERSALTIWTATPFYGAMLGYALVLGPFGIASNRLITNIGILLGAAPR